MLTKDVKDGSPPYNVGDLQRLGKAREIASEIDNLMGCIINSLDAN